MNPTNFGLIIICITILGIKRCTSQYGSLEDQIKAIKEYQKKLGEFVDKYTKDVDDFKEAQVEAGRDIQFKQFENNLLTLYKKTLKNTTDIMNELDKLRDATKDVAGDVLKLHHQFVETRTTWDSMFSKLWKDYSAFLSGEDEEEEVEVEEEEPQQEVPESQTKKSQQKEENVKQKHSKQEL